MRRMKHDSKIFRILLPVLFAAALGGSAWGQQALYKCEDEDGNQIRTNIPPSNCHGEISVIGAVPPQEPAAAPAREDAYNPIIEKYAADFQLDPSLIRSIIATESGFNARAVSPKGAQGLMQLMPATARRLGVRNSFDPEENIRGGVRHFRTLMDNFNNDIELSLAAYNAGENLVQRLGRVPNIRETQNYVQLVTSRYGKQQPEEGEVEEEIHPPAFQFVDETGVLHLTNIPPTR